MKRSVVIKRGMFLVVLCVAAWQLPNILEQTLTLRDRFSAGSPARTTVSLPTPPPKRAGERQLVVISPSGESLSAEEQGRLRKAAEAAAPMRVGRSRVEDPLKPQEGAEDTAALDDPASQLDQMLEEAVEKAEKDPKGRNGRG